MKKQISVMMMFLATIVFSFGPLFSVATAQAYTYRFAAEDGSKEDPDAENPGDPAENEDDSTDDDTKGAPDDSDDSEDEDVEKGDDGDEEKGDDLSDIFGDWENPYTSPDDLLSALNTAEKSGTCWDLMNVKFNLFSAETRYWRARVAPGSDGATTLDTVLDSLKKLQIVIGENRTALEKRAGATQSCEENEVISFIQEPLEDLKTDMRLAAYQVDTTDFRELDEDIVDARCEKAEEKLHNLAEKMSALQDDLLQASEDGDVAKVSNTKELLNRMKINFGNSGSFFKGNTKEDDLSMRMEVCSGAYDEAEMGAALSTRADKYYDGKREDDSSDVDQLDAKIKMFLDVIADKRVQALHYDNKEAILAALANAETEIIAVQSAFADVKYEKNPNVSAFDAQLEEIKLGIKVVVDVMLEGSESSWTDAQREQSASKLLASARKQLNTLNTQVGKKENKADTETESDILTYVDQSLADDALNAKKAAKAFQTAEDFEQAQLQAYAAIMAAKTAKSLLAEIQ